MDVDVDKQPGDADRRQPFSQLSPIELGDAQRLVVGETGLLERVRERVVPDVVEQGGEAGGGTVFLGHGVEFAPLREAGQRAPGQVVGAEGVLEAGMGGAGIDQEGVAQSCRT